jgi:hypothetical protein
VSIIDWHHHMFSCIVYVSSFPVALKPSDLSVQDYFVAIIITIVYHCNVVIWGFHP